MPAKKPNLFESAKPMAQPEAKSKKDKPEGVTITGLADRAAVGIVLTVFERLKESLDGLCKAQGDNYFISEGRKAKKRPANFEGVDGDAVASFQLKDRASNSALSDTEKELCAKFDIPTKTVTETVETYVFNQAYIHDQKLLLKISALLEGHGLPNDLIQKQVGSSYTVIDPAAIDKVFTLQNEEDTRLMLKVVNTQALAVLSPKPPKGDVELSAVEYTAMARVAKLLQPNKVEVKPAREKVPA